MGVHCSHYTIVRPAEAACQHAASGCGCSFTPPALHRPPLVHPHAVQAAASLKGAADENMAQFKRGFLLPKAEREKLIEKRKSDIKNQETMDQPTVQPAPLTEMPARPEINVPAESVMEEDYLLSLSLLNKEDQDKQEVNCSFHESIQTKKDNILRIIENKETRQLSEKSTEKDEKNKETFAAKKKGLWKSIQSFHSSQGSFRREAILQQHVDSKIQEKFPDIDDKTKEEKIKRLLEKARFKYLKPEELKNFNSSLAELQVDEALTRIMRGRPGLLLRNLRCKQSVQHKMGTFKYLKGILSDDFAPYCPYQLGEHQHDQECHDGEADIILMYPDGEKLHVIIIEVKKEENLENLNTNNIEDGLRQLRKDVLLIHNVLPDVPKERLDIKFFLALPNKEAKEYDFCDRCLNYIITKEYLTGTVESSTMLRRKLMIKRKIKLNVSEGAASMEEFHSQDLLLTASSRFIDQHTNIAYDKDLRNFVIKFENNIEKELIVFDEDQCECLGIVENNPDIRNFIFIGASGTGKTLLAIRTIHDLIRKYHQLGKKKIYIYALAARGTNKRSPSKLLNFFKENIKIPHDLQLQPEPIEIKIFCNDVHEIYEKHRNKKQYRFIGVHNPQVIELLRRKLTKQHADGQVILFIDELENNDNWDEERFLNNDSMMSERMHSKTPDTVLILTFNPGTSQQNDYAIAENPRDKLRSKPEAGDYRSPFTKDGNDFSVRLFMGMENLFQKHLTLRYRSSSNIQKLTRFLMNSMDSFALTNMQPETGEIDMAPIEGDIPVWYDIGRYTDDEGPGNLKIALEKMLSISQKFSHARILLHEDTGLYDLVNEETGELEKKFTVLEEQIGGLQEPRKIEVSDTYRGSEEDCVIYIGGGDLGKG